MIELNIEQQDIAGLHNFTRLLISYCRPYLADDAGRSQELMEIVDCQEDGPDQAFEKEMQRIEVCLGLLREKNLYGYSEARLGSSDALYSVTEEAT